jgi:hypothetical protein
MFEQNWQLPNQPAAEAVARMSSSAHLMLFRYVVPSRLVSNIVLQHFIEKTNNKQ